MDNIFIKQIEEKCRDMKFKALELALSTGSNGSHVGGAFSSMEIFATLYALVNISNMQDVHRDRVIVSKGHCVLSYYTALWKQGILKEDDLLSFDKNGTKLHGHPHRNLSLGLEFSSGSLGLGISYAVGVALACKRNGLDNKIYVILGDGECDEGIVWEAMMSISNFQLNNIVVIVDRNGYQLDGATDEIMNQYSLEDKFHAFGFDVDIVNGHSVKELYNSFTKPADTVKAIIANTVKANGISFLMNNKIAHHCVLSPKKYDRAVEDIKVMYDGKE